MTCREAIDRLAEYLDAELTPATLAELETHLAACAPCRAYLATYRETRELAAKAHRVEIPGALRARRRPLPGGERPSSERRRRRAPCPSRRAGDGARGARAASRATRRRRCAGHAPRT